MLHRLSAGAVCWVCATLVDMKLPSAKKCVVWHFLDPPPLWAPGVIPEAPRLGCGGGGGAVGLVISQSLFHGARLLDSI